MTLWRTRCENSRGLSHGINGGEDATTRAPFLQLHWPSMGKMHAGCPLCDGTRKTPHPDYTEHHLVRCSNCGFYYAELEPSNEELAKYYSNYPMPEQLSPITAQRYHEWLRSFEPYRRNGRLLDMGCGAGMFLQRALAAGWEAYGTEYPTDVVERCKSKGLKMHQGPVSTHPWPKEHFDVIVTIEVIEHVPFPFADLRVLVELLRPGGVLYITTPNFNSISKWLLGKTWDVVCYPEHLSLFTPRTMHRTLTSLGLEKVHLRTTGISFHRINIAKGKPTQVNGVDSDEEMRRKIETKWYLKGAKAMINGLLNFSKRGDTIKVLYRKKG